MVKMLNMMNPNGKYSGRFMRKNSYQPKKFPAYQAQTYKKPVYQPKAVVNPPIYKPAKNVRKSTAPVSVINQPSVYPWTNNGVGQQINGYYMWANNFVNTTPAIQFFPDSVYSPQSLPENSAISTNSFITSSYQQFTYPEYPYEISNPDINSVFFFTGYSNAATALSTALTGGMYSGVIGSMSNISGYNQNPTSSSVLIGLVLGGATQNGGWSPGTEGAIYSCYEAFTASGMSFSYTETGTGITQTGTGSGIFGGTTTVNGVSYSLMNSIIFDIESWGSSGGSTGQDFLNLFTYIKTNQNSVVNQNSGGNIIIIVTIAHSCSNFNGTGQSVCSTILANQGYYPGTGSSTSNPEYTWDYISPQMYTENVGTMNEYAANTNIYWTGGSSFTSYLLENPNIATYGLNLLLPSALQYSLYTSGGTNQGNPPNNYFYQSSPNNVNPIVETAITSIDINYSVDTGLLSFFNTIFSTTKAYSNLGGCISWINGTLSDMPTTAPSSLSDIGPGGYIWLDSNNNYWSMYVGGNGNGQTAGSVFNNPIYIPTGSAYNTLITQVYGAGAGGGGGGTNIESDAETNPNGDGGGGGAGSYCCFSVSSADPLNGLIELYIPGGGGGGIGAAETGGNGGGGGQDGNDGGDLTVTNFQLPTSVWWNSASLNGAYTLVSSAPSGVGGMGFDGSNILANMFPNNPYVANLIPSILNQISTYTGLSASTTAELLQLLSAAYVVDAPVDGFENITSDLQTAGTMYALYESINTYQSSLQGSNGAAPLPNLNNIGTPYASYTLNSFFPLQSGTNDPSTYTSTPIQSSSGGVVNQISYNTGSNPFNLGGGGTGGGGANANGYPGTQGAVIFTLTNSTPGNSI